MRNQPGTPSRRSLGFEDLEDRHLLNGGSFIGARPEVVITGPTVSWSLERPADFAAIETVARGTHGNPSAPGGDSSWQGGGLADRPGGLSSEPGPGPSFATATPAVALSVWAGSSQPGPGPSWTPDEPAHHPGDGAGLPSLGGGGLADQSGAGSGPGTGSESPYPSAGSAPWRPDGLQDWPGKGTGLPLAGAAFFTAGKDFGGPPEPFYLVRVESQTPGLPGLNLAGATALAASFSAQGNRLEPGATEPSTTAPGNLLVGSNPVGPQGVAAIVGNTTGSVSGGPSAPLAAASGGLPAQLGPIWDAGGTAERHWSVGAARERTVAMGALPSGGALAVPIHNTAAPTTRHWSLRPATAAEVPAAEGGEDRLSPRGADLIAEALPFDRASLEAALDQFVRQLDELDIRRLTARGPAPIAVFVLTALGSAASMEFARRFWRRRLLIAKGIPVGDPVVREIPLGFPELPGSWSERVR